ncbi:hypothetical protein J2S70_001352 [Trueperella bonasi]|uniref:Uncharacterized protein n=1 Tax=Trueperella bonasi TaxID=312286 RepID=A0ABT9NHC2_9ACTO|nr:hypothetical protein [Trueperella bonasi]
MTRVGIRKPLFFGFPWLTDLPGELDPSGAWACASCERLAFDGTSGQSRNDALLQEKEQEQNW